jgi:hypothetical protein
MMMKKKYKKMQLKSWKPTSKEKTQNDLVSKSTIFFILPLLVVIIGYFAVDFLKSGISVQFEEKDSAGRYIFSVSNKGDIIDFTISKGEISKVHRAFKPIRIGDYGHSVYDSNGKEGTLVVMPINDFLGENQEIINFRNLNIASGEKKKLEIKYLQNAGIEPYLIDFFIAFNFRPKNSILNIFHQILVVFNKRFGRDGSYFRFEDGRITNLGEPPSNEEFDRLAFKKFKEIGKL